MVNALTFFLLPPTHICIFVTSDLVLDFLEHNLTTFDFCLELNDYYIMSQTLKSPKAIFASLYQT